jgi:hypothetical protein
MRTDKGTLHVVLPMIYMSPPLQVVVYVLNARLDYLISTVYDVISEP